MKHLLKTFFLKILFIISFGSSAYAGKPEPWQLGLQEAASPFMEQVSSFHDGLLLWTCIVISVFVLILLAIVILRFNRKANPVPSKTSHNTALEIVWTLVPVIILLAISIPSLRHLTYMKTIPDSDLTIKVTGRQWYWDYAYPDQGDIEFSSTLITDKEQLNGEPYLLAVDNKLVLPVGKNIRFIITGGDVIHSWAIPALGVKMDAVPGRINETWTHINKEGVYYGQCSELCGKDHGFMPIAIEAVSEEKFNEWVAKKKADELASSNSTKFING